MRRMQLNALLRHSSPHYAGWLADDLLKQVYRGIVFVRRGDDFLCVEDPLTPETLAMLKDDPSIWLEISHTMLPVGR